MLRCSTWDICFMGTVTGETHFQMLEGKLMPELDISTSKTECFYQGADKSLPRPTSRCILFDGQNISFDATCYIYKQY